MNRWIGSIVGLGFGLLLAADTAAESPMVTIEVAIVVRTQIADGAISVSDELKNAFAEVDLTDQGLIHFLQQWKSGSDAMPVAIESLRVKSELGARVEVQTQRILDPDPRDEENSRPDRMNEHVGMDAFFQAKQSDNGQILLNCRFGKNTHDGGLARYPEQGRMVTRPRVGTTNMTAVITLTPGQPYVMDAMRHSNTIDGKSVRSETTYVYLARLQEEKDP